MSKFNFISGGYFGKLGQTVGQRWRNTRMVRSYVIPENPRTPDQQANRADFAGATKASQLAMQLNAGLRLWKTADNTEFNNRMSSARKYYTDGMKLVQFVPALPYGKIADYAVSPVVEKSGRNLTFSCGTLDDIGGRTMSVLVHIKNTANDADVYEVLHGMFTGSAGAWSFTVTIPTGYTIPNDSYVLAVSNDDDLHDGKIIYLSPQPTIPPKTVVSLTVTDRTAHVTSNGSKYVTFTFAETLAEIPQDIAITASGSYQLQGLEVPFDSSYQTEFSATDVKIVFGAIADAHGNPCRFSTSSTLMTPAMTIETDNYIYSLPATSGALNGDENRTDYYQIDFTQVSQSLDTNGLRVNTSLTMNVAQTVAGNASFAYYAKGSETESTASGNVADFNNLYHAIVITQSDEEKHYTGNRTVTLGARIGLVIGGCYYEIPAGTQFTQTAVTTTHYTETATATYLMGEYDGETQEQIEYFRWGASFAGKTITATYVVNGRSFGLPATKTISGTRTLLSGGIDRFRYKYIADDTETELQLPRGSTIQLTSGAVTLGMTDYTVTSAVTNIAGLNNRQEITPTWTKESTDGKIATGYINYEMDTLPSAGTTGTIEIPTVGEMSNEVAFTITWTSKGDGKTYWRIETDTSYLAGANEDAQLDSVINFTIANANYRLPQTIPYTAFPVDPHPQFTVDYVARWDRNYAPLIDSGMTLVFEYDFQPGALGNVTASDFDETGDFGYVIDANNRQCNIISKSIGIYQGNLCVKLGLDTAYTENAHYDIGEFYMSDNYAPLGATVTFTTGAEVTFTDADSLELIDGQTYRVIS